VSDRVDDFDWSSSSVEKVEILTVSIESWTLLGDRVDEFDWNYYRILTIL